MPLNVSGIVFVLALATAAAMAVFIFWRSVRFATRRLFGARQFYSRREWISTQTVKPIPVPKITLALGQTTTLVNVFYDVCYSISNDEIRLHKARMSDGKLNGGNNAASFRGYMFKMPDGVISSRQLLELARVELAEPNSGLKRRMFGRWNDPR